jgi:dTDP-glucose pyrophosphorylase
MISRSRFLQAIISPDTPILDAIKAIDLGGIQAAFVVDERDRLIGVSTDGDIRRGILKGYTLDSPIAGIMNRKPFTLGLPASREQAVGLMAKTHIRQIPVTDSEGRIVGAYHIDAVEEAKPENAENWAVIMAGGRGTRLHPLTESTPKPMLNVGGSPLIETIIRMLAGHGFQRIYIAVNYMAEAFKDHFGDGRSYGVDIRYLEEDARLGTAGALGLIQERPTKPLLVMNGDLLTSVNFSSLLSFHNEHKSLSTMCVRDYRVHVPYGVIDIDGQLVNSITEKPTMTYFVNAGIYVVEPELIDRITPGTYLDMTQLLEQVIADGGRVNTFPIHEYWLDIGQLSDLERARVEFHGIFGS